MSWLFWAGYAALWVVVAVLAAAMVMMLREHADLVLGSREGRSRLHGPPEGTAAPKLEGDEVRPVEGYAPGPRIVLFMAVTCQPCHQRRPQISYFAADHGDTVDTVVTCSGSVEDVRDFAVELGPEVSVLADPAGDTAAKWRVFMTPFAVGVDGEGIVRGKVANPGYDTLLLLARLLTVTPDTGSAT
ncbi:MAG: hypothetical protein F4Z33_01515 [Gemmatimonadales bacterium]|nr:hypothetical protein [Gemmatimonadales bacterium]MYC87711.1 hypothetical protein [Candidatus Palauibacter denitrificans]MYE70876.1 hypothetical protein [Gemmatimonadota bacterium]